MTGRIGKLVRLGAFTTVSVAATVVVVASLLNVQTEPTKGYRAIFTDASGLQSGDPVRIAGVKVGSVTAVKLAGTDAEVDFQVASNQVVDGRTAAAIHYESLLGQRNLTLIRGTSSASGPGCGSRCIPLSRTTPALDLTDLFNGFQPLFSALTPSDVNALTANIISTFQGESGNVAGLVAEAANLTTNLADRDQVIDQVVGNVAQVMQVLGDHNQQLGQLIDSLSTLTGDLAGERQTISSAISGASSLTQSLNGVIGSVQQPLETDIAGLDTGLGTIGANKSKLDALLAQTPKTLTNVDRMFENGGFAKAYVCSTEIIINHPIILVPDVIQESFNIAPGVLSLLDNTLVVNLPSGSIGNPSEHAQLRRMSTFREKNLRVLGAVGAAVAVLLLAGGLEFAKLPFSTHYDYHADLSEAGQIQGGEEVTVAGVKVGTTQGMTLVIHPGGSYVRLNFELDRRLEMGTGTTLAVKVLSPLGQEYVQLAPAGSGQLKPGSTIPLAHTSVSGTLADTLGQLGQTVGAINTNQLSQALQVLNGDLSATAPAATQSLIDGLGRLSTVINDNQSQIDQLVRAANQVVTTLNGHKVQLLSLIGQSNLILQVVSQRQADLSALLSSTRSLASHLSSIMDSKTSNLGTLLSELNTVSGVLARNSSNLQQIVPLAAALARYGANATGNGPYVDAITPLPFIDDEDVAACGLPGAFVTGLDGTSCQLGTNGLPSGGSL